MRNVLIILTTCLLALATGAQAQEKKKVFTANDVELTVGGQSELVINMDYETQETVVGWNIYLCLPEGVDLLYDEDEEDYVYTVSSALHKKALRNSFKIKNTESGAYMLYCIDTSDLTPMTATKGELLRITLTADATAADVSKGYLKDIALTNSDNVSIDLNNIQDVEFSIYVEGGVTTGINRVNAANRSDVRYNTQGQRVGPSYRGVVVEEGRKVVVVK